MCVRVHNGFVDGEKAGRAQPGGGARLPSRWADVQGLLPASLESLTGPADGVVELPIDLAWSSERSFDLADPVQRMLYQMTVLNAAVTPEHYTRWLNADLLRSDWAGLRLPGPLRDTWQGRFPELGGGR